MRNDDFQLFDLVDQPVFVLVADADDRPIYRFVNAAASQYIGKQLDALRDLPAYRIYEGRAGHSVYRQQCLLWAAKVAAQYEIALPLGQSTRWVRTKLLPVCDAAGKMTHMVGTSQDITAQRDQLQAHAMAAASAREMEDLVCFAAHDLRTPISNLKSLAVLMRTDFVDHGDGKAELIDMVDAISDKALMVVTDIMAKAMATSMSSPTQTFDLGGLCDDIMVLLDPTRVHCVAYPSRYIDADNMAVHIALRNLIDNALKHSGTKAAQVVIDVVPMNAERLLFTVTDKGGGFTDEAFKKQDVRQSNDTACFGLSGIERLVHSRGGQIAVMARTKGNGAQVRMELPGRIVAMNAAEDKALRTG